MRGGLLALAVAAVLAARAQEFRAINPIRSPRVPVPAGAERVVPQQPVSREAIGAAVNAIAAAWNTPALDGHLSKDFYDRHLLLENLGSQAPRDATLRVVGIQGYQVLDQYHLAPTAQLPYRVMVTQVSVTVRTQVEFSSASGFQRLDGTNEWILDLPEPAP